MLRFCKKYAFKYKKEIVFYFLLGMVTCIISTIIPWVLGSFINMFDETITYEHIIGYVGVLLSLYIVKELVGYFTQIIYIRLQTNVAFRLNFDIIEHLKKTSPLVFGKTDLSYVSQRINNDANDVLIFFISSFTNLVMASISTIMILVLIYQVSITAFIITSCLLVLYLLVYVFFRKSIYAKSYDAKEEKALFFARLQEQLEKSEFIKIHGTNHFFVDKLNMAYQKLYKALFKQQITLQAFASLENIVGAISICILFAVSGLEIIKGNMQIGFFLVISAYFDMIIEYGKTFIDYGREYQEAHVSFDRIKNLLDVPVQPNGLEKIYEVKSIELRDVTFAYDNANVLTNFNVQFKKDHIYGIKGENGHGKSTLIKLLLGLYIEEYKGEILYNGINIKKMDMDFLRTNIVGFTEQEAVLLSDTIYHNITLYNEVDDEYISEVALLFDECPILEKKNRNIVLNEKSSNISGGEKQKIAIVRQIVKDTSVMIFDEPTSALDVESVKQFLKLIVARKNDKIIILVSHDKRVLDICDEIICV